MAVTSNEMIVHHARRLHKRITDRRPDEFKSPRFQIFAHRIRFLRPGRDVSSPAAPVDLRRPADEGPDVPVESPKLLLHRQKRLRVLDRRRDLQPVADNAGIGHQLRTPFCVILRNFLRIEPIKRFAIILPLRENRRPAQPRLRAFQNDEFKQRPVVVMRATPFLIVIFDIERFGRPRTALRDSGH